MIIVTILRKKLFSWSKVNLKNKYVIYEYTVIIIKYAHAKIFLYFFVHLVLNCLRYLLYDVINQRNRTWNTIFEKTILIHGS